MQIIHIIEIYMRIMNIIAIIEIQMRIMNIMQILEIVKSLNIMTTHENHENLTDNYEHNEQLTTIM